MSETVGSIKAIPVALVMWNYPQLRGLHLPQKFVAIRFAAKHRHRILRRSKRLISYAQRSELRHVSLVHS